MEFQDNNRKYCSCFVPDLPSEPLHISHYDHECAVGASKTGCDWQVRKLQLCFSTLCIKEGTLDQQDRLMVSVTMLHTDYYCCLSFPCDIGKKHST